VGSVAQRLGITMSLQAMPSLLTYSARPPLGSVVEGVAINSWMNLLTFKNC